MVKKGDKFTLTDQTIERFVEDVVDASVKKSDAFGEKSDPDIAGNLKQVAQEYKQPETEVAERFREWTKKAKDSTDYRKHGLAAIAVGNYPLAEQNFVADAKERLREATQSWELAGDVAEANTRYMNAVDHYLGLHRLDLIAKRQGEYPLHECRRSLHRSFEVS